MLRNCRRCDRIFLHSIYDICPPCREQEEQECTLVRDYVSEFPGSSVSQVSEATSVSSERILHFLRQGRLSAQTMGVTLQCEVCEGPVTSGRICDDCRERLQKTTSKRGSQPRMHIDELERLRTRRRD